MSWLNLNNLSNIKGQISSFASGVLAEGVIGDNTDPSDDENLQVTIAGLKDEIEKLKEENLQYQTHNNLQRKNVEIDEDNDDGWSWDTRLPDVVDKTVLSELRKKNEELEAEKKELYNSLELLDVENKETTDKLISIKDNLQKENSKLRQEQDEIKKKNELLLKINEDTQKKLDSLEKSQDKNGNSEAAMEEICLCTSSQELESSQQKIYIDELEIKILQLEEEILILRDENSKLNLINEERSLNLNSVSQKDAKISELEKKIEWLPRQYLIELHENLGINLNEIENTDFIQNISKLISDYKSKCEDLECKLMNFNNQNGETKKLLSERDELFEELVHSKTEYKDLSKELLVSKEELQHIKEKFDMAIKENTELESYKTKSEEEVSTKIEEIKIISKKYEDLSQELSKIKEDWDSSKTENQKLSQELEHSKGEHKEISNDFSRNQQELNNLKNKNDELSKELSINKEELKHFKSECEALSKNNEALIDRIQENSNLLPISENNEDSLLELEKELEESKQQIHELENVIEKSKIVTEVDVLKKQLGATGNELDQTKQEYEHLKNYYKQLEEDNSHLKTNLEDMKLTYDVCCNEKEDLNSAVDQIKFEYENTEYKFAEQNINMETLNEEIETHMKEIEKLKEENKNLIAWNEDTNTKMELSQKEIEDLKQELTTVFDSVQEREEEIKQLTELLSSSDETEILRNKIEEFKMNENNLLLQLNEHKSLLEISIKEKEIIDESYKSVTFQLDNLKTEHLKVTNAVTNLTNEKSILNDSLSQMKQLIYDKHQENINYHEEIKRLQQALSEQFEKSQSYQTQLQTLDDSLPTKEEVGKKIQEIEKLSEQNSFLNEKCKKLTDILVKEQAKVTKLTSENSSANDKELVLEKRLEKLRQHLLEMENSYTEEIQKTEEKYEEAKFKLQQAEEREKNSSNRYTSVNIRANQQVETLQTQLQLVTNQRDELRAKVSELEDEIGKKNAALVNLQIVLQQFQREKEADIHNETDRIRRQITLEKEKQVSLQKEINDLKLQLEESKEALKAASRLSEQVNVYKEQVNLLKIEVDNLQQKLKKSEQQCANLISRTDSKVDKLLIKNLILGFLSSNNYSCNQDQTQILKIISSVLDFNQNDMEKAKMNANVHNSWFDALLHPKVAESSTTNQESLTQAFVKFLQDESAPKNLPNLLDATSTAKQETVSNNEATNKRQSPIVLNEIVLPTFADFGRNRNSSSILKDVLKDNT